jgi:hypothetical protein
MKTGIESLQTGAPEITYSGDQGPKSPQEDQRMMQEYLMSQIEEEYSRHVFEMEEQGLQPMSMQEFMQQVLAEGQMSSNEEPTMQMPMDMEQDPRTMAAKGGIMDTEEGFAMQAGVKNYLGEQETISDVPIKWQSGPSHPKTELAYITKAEKDLLLKKDLHNSLKNGPNKGPGGIISLNSAGDGGGSGGAGTGGSDGFGGGSDSAGAERDGGGNQAAEAAAAAKAAADRAAADRAAAAAAAANVETEAEKIARLALLKKKEEEEAARTATFKTPTTGYNLYDVDQSNKNVMLGLGVDPRMFAADGGRMNYDMGGIASARASALNKMYGYDDEDEIKKNFAYGGSTGLPPVTLALPGQDVQSFPDDESTGMAQATPQMPMNPQMMNQQMMNPQMAGLMSSRQAAAFGGLMGEDGRRAYGFGSFFKKITSIPRKLVKTVKKISKSKIGKMALMAAAMYYAPALATRMGGSTMAPGSFMQTLASGRNLQGFEKLRTIGSAFKTLAPGGVSPFSGQQSTLFNFMKPGIKDVVKNVAKEKAKKSFLSPSTAFMGITALSSLAGLKAAKQGQEPLDEATSRENDFNPFDEYGGVAGLRKKVLAGNLDRGEFAFQQQPMYAANGGRIGYQDAGPVIDQETQAMILDMNNRGMDIDTISTITQQDAATINAILSAQNQKAMGGRMGYAEGGDEGELLDMGGMEKDYRNDGGFVPMGEYERKDDVPARLSKNEFVFTADAVRNAGGGDIDKGAEIMENMMENLEQGGKVSKGSQGLSGAREMFATQQRLGEVL